MSPSTVSELDQKIYVQIETWRQRPIEGNHPYVFLDESWLKRNWGGEVRNVSLLVAIGVNDEGYRKVLAVADGSKEDKASWTAFSRHLKERGLKGVRLFVSDKCLGLVESLGEFYPEALWKQCAVHFYRNVWTAVPTSKVKEVAAILKAIHAQEDRTAARQKAEQVAAKLKEMKLADAAALVITGCVPLCTCKVTRQNEDSQLNLVVFGRLVFPFIALPDRDSSHALLMDCCLPTR